MKWKKRRAENRQSAGVGGVAAVAAVLSLLAGGLLGAATLGVPADYPTIKAAVNHASDGDIVLVEDGTYLENNIVIARRIQVRSRNLFGAVVYGSPRISDAIFIVRAAARIEGFVLKGAALGIEQRGSPDVRWQAADLVVADCFTGLSVNDAEASVGSADIRNVVIIGAGNSTGVCTNDAGRVDISGCLIMDCRTAFDGYDHLSFRVKDSAVLDCVMPVFEGTRHRPVAPATSRIEMGGNVLTLGSASFRDARRLAEYMSFVRRFVLPSKAGAGTYSGHPAAREAALALILARAIETAGEPDIAAQRYEEARAAAERAGSREFVWQALLGRARLEVPGGDLGRSIASYERAFGHLEDWALGIPRGLSQVDFLADKAPVFEALTGLLLEGQRRDPSSGYAERAFDYAERYRFLSRLLPSPAGSSTADGGPGMTAAKAAAAEEIAGAQRRLQDPDLGAGKKAGLIARLEAAEEDYRSELIRGGKSRPEPSPLDFREVRQRLAGRAILSYVVGEKASFAFLATEAGLECARLPAGRELVDMVEPYLRFLQLDDTRDFRGVKAGRVLFDALLGPFAARLPSLPRRIIVVPDGRLSYVPFEALVVDGGVLKGVGGGEGRGDGRREWRFWGESAVISYAPSATQALAGPGGGEADRAPWRVLAVGSEDGIRCDNRAADRKRFFLPLAHVGDEIKGVAGSFPKGAVTIQTGRDATERAFKTADLGAYAIIHLAAHGVIDDTNWWRSALLLGPDEGDGEDGFLTALEIADLGVKARLVVLSACSTGAGRLFKGDGLRGLSGAFLRAGAEDLVVSLWNIDDKASAAFMGRFYGRIAGGEPPALALAWTKKWMIESGYRNPFYWAPFVLIGRAGQDR